MKKESKLAQLFTEKLGQTSPYPLLIEIDRAEGSYIYDKSGKKYLDLIAGVAVNNIGHNHPLVVDAIKNQLDRHMHVMVYGEFVQDAEVKLAILLTDLLPETLNTVYPVNSGTEANEAAVKLARRFTGRKEIIAFRGAYHGNTLGSLSLSDNSIKKKPFEPLLSEVNWINFNEMDDLSLITEQTAGVIIETVQGDAGVRKATSAYLHALREKCNSTGTQLIFDEIQCGMGRTGKNFAFEHSGIVPDILTLGKALGGGMPIGALVSDKKKLDAFTVNPSLGHISTFAGHPVICAAAAAGIEVLKTIDYNEVELIGRFIEEKLSEHPKVQEIRRVGFMFAIDMESADFVNSMVKKCIKYGVFSYWFLSHPGSFRLSPPLTLSKHEAEEGVTILLKALDEL